MFDLLMNIVVVFIVIVLVVAIGITVLRFVDQYHKPVQYTDEQKIHDIYISIMKENDD